MNHQADAEARVAAAHAESDDWKYRPRGGTVHTTFVAAPDATARASLNYRPSGVDVRVAVGMDTSCSQVTLLSLGQAKQLHDSLAHVLLAAEIRAAEGAA